jgi:peroxiredoxin
MTPYRRVGSTAKGGRFSAGVDKLFGTADLQGKVTVVVFWAAGCAPCAEQLQLIEKSWQRHQSEGLVVLGIQQGLLLEPDDPGFAKANGVTFPNVRDTCTARLGPR